MAELDSYKMQVLNNYVDTLLKNSERCGSTPTLESFKSSVLNEAQYLFDDDAVANEAVDNISVENKYKSSLQSCPREVDGNYPVEETDDWVDKAHKLDSAYKDKLNKILNTTLDDSVKTGKTPNKDQILIYLKTKLVSLVASDEGIDSQQGNYVVAYETAWIDNVVPSLYDTSLSEHPREVTNQIPNGENDNNNKNNIQSQTTVTMPRGIKTKAIPKSASLYLNSYKTFSGTDMVATFELPVGGSGGSIVKVMGELQTISYSIHNEKMPVRVLGNMNALGYVFNGRTIAGSLVFTVFDKHWARDLMEEYLKTTKQEAHFMADELPPINITISFANEYGQDARLAIYGVTFVNEGQVMSVQDMYMENTFQYYATDIDYMCGIGEDGSSGTVPLGTLTKLPTKKDNKTNAATDNPDKKNASGDKATESKMSEATGNYIDILTSGDEYDQIDYGDASEEEYVALLKDVYTSKISDLDNLRNHGKLSKTEYEKYSKKLTSVWKDKVDAARELYAKNREDRGE